MYFYSRSCVSGFWRILFLDFWIVLFFVLACNKAENATPKQNSSPALSVVLADAGAVPSDDVQLILASRLWLNLFKERESEKLVERTQFPFSYVSTNLVKPCEGSRADAKALLDFVKCTADGQREPILNGLIMALKRTDDPNASIGFRLRVVRPEEVLWLAEVIRRPLDNEKLVRTVLYSGGIEYDVVLMMAGSGMAAIVNMMALNIELHE
ncbi:hypothetical protein WMF30_32430 [Sorangium sp. So ce134]